MRSKIFEDKKTGLTAFLNDEFPVANSNRPLLEIANSSTGWSNFYREDEIVEETIDDLKDVSAEFMKAKLLEKNDGQAVPLIDLSKFDPPSPEPDEWLRNAMAAIDEAYDELVLHKNPNDAPGET
jgi:hypothetical protein